MLPPPPLPGERETERIAVLKQVLPDGTLREAWRVLCALCAPQGGAVVPAELLADREQIIVELRETNEVRLCILRRAPPG